MAFNTYSSNPKTIHDSEEGDSQIYVGIKYLGIVAQEINEVRMAGKLARSDPTQIMHWLTELQVFYDLIENRTGIHNSTEKSKLYKYTFNVQSNTLDREEIEVEEKMKYEIWFEEITKMIERNATVALANGTNPYLEKRYLNNKKILLELGKCQRELLRDANKRHLIMPEGMKDMKQLVKDEWLDRDATKSF